MLEKMAAPNMQNENQTVPQDFIGEKYWFFLYWIAKIRSRYQNPIPTSNLIKEVPFSQQTISRRVIYLEKQGLISRKFENTEGFIDLTAEAYIQLERVYEDLHVLFEEEHCIDRFQGELTKGMGEGGHYIKHPKYLEQFYQKIGFFPYFGTLNIRLKKEIHQMLMKHLRDFQSIQIEGFKEQSRTYGEVTCYKVQLWPKDQIHRQVPGALLQIERTSHDPYIIEFISEQFLRDFFNLKDGDSICFQFINEKEGCKEGEIELENETEESINKGKIKQNKNN